MTNNTITQETAKINELIASYKNNKKNLLKEIDEIDEKYRIIAEAEKAALTDAVAFYDNAISALALIAEKDPMAQAAKSTEELKKDVPTEPKVVTEAEEDKVVDNLFPENNETETKEDEPVEEDAPAEDPGPEFDGAGFTSEDEPATAEGSDEPLSTEEFTDPNDWGSQVTGW